MAILDYRLEGFVGSNLDQIRREETPVHWVRMSVEHPSHVRSTDWISENDFRPDVLTVARRFMSDYRPDSRQRGTLPTDWEERILGMEGSALAIQGTHDLAIKVGTLDLNRLAEIAHGGSVIDPKRDDEGRIILSRDDFLIEFRGCIADQLMNANRYCDPTQMWQAPSESTLGSMVADAGQVYDKYMGIPVGSLMVTKDFIFPYVVGRKQFSELRWNGYEKYCGHTDRGARIPTADVCVHFTGIQTDCAPHMMKNPVFRADYSFPMEFIGSTVTVPKQQEKEYIENAVNSMGEFHSIWVQNPPYKIVKDEGMTAVRGYNWSPVKSELIRASNVHLGIDS